jgi:hypothetical protein
MLAGLLYLDIEERMQLFTMVGFEDRNNLGFMLVSADVGPLGPILSRSSHQR